MNFSSVSGFLYSVVVPHFLLRLPSLTLPCSRSSALVILATFLGVFLLYESLVSWFPFCASSVDLSSTTPTSPDYLPDFGEFDLPLICSQGIPVSQVKVYFNAANNRQSNDSIEDQIELTWKNLLKKKSGLKNMSKFRFSKAELILPSSPQNHREVAVHLHLGLTDYKSFLGTNLHASTWWSLLQQSRSPHHYRSSINSLTTTTAETSEDDSVFLANALGTAGIIETSDGYVVMLHRSANVAEAPNSVIFTGGHPEPSRLGILRAEQEVQDITGAEIVRELFDSAVREACEETGLQRSELGTPLLIGVSRRRLNHRPDVCFVVPCTLTHAQVEQRYLHGVVADRFESSKLMLIRKENLELETQKMLMPGCHRGALALYLKHLSQRSSSTATTIAES